MFTYVCIHTQRSFTAWEEWIGWRKTRTKEKRSEVTVIQVRYNGGLNKGCGRRDGKTWIDFIWGPKASLRLELSPCMDRSSSVTQIKRREGIHLNTDLNIRHQHPYFWEQLWCLPLQFSFCVCEICIDDSLHFTAWKQVFFFSKGLK